MLLHLLQQRGQRESLGEVEDHEARENFLASSIPKPRLRGNPLDLLQEPTETRFQFRSQFGYFSWSCLGLLGDRLQDDLPPTSIVMNMLLILPHEDREVRPFVETVSHDPDYHLDAVGVILESVQLSDSSPAGAVEPVSVELRSMVDVVATQAVSD